MPKQVAEIWKDVLEYEGYYQVSNHGRVKSLARNSVDGRKLSSCIITPRLDRYGYVRVWLYKDGDRKEYRIHRLVAIAFVPNPDNKCEVNHKNGIKNYNYDNNLEWVTSSENHRHSVHVLGNRTQDGEQNSQAKLTFTEVKEIRRLQDSGMSRKDIAIKFKVTPTTISDIWTRRGWNYTAS